MKKFIYLFLSVSLFIFYSISVQASSFYGSETRWRNLGNDTFEITITAYVRCTDITTSFLLSPPTISSDSCANAYTINMGAPLDSTYFDLTPVCRAQQSPCAISGGSGSSSATIPSGYLKVTWRYKIYLGGQYANCCWYKIRWTLCCRSSNISTGAADAQFTNDAWLNRCITNSSPVFTNDPMVMKCTGQDVVYNNGAVDAENDSLSYRLAPLVTGSYSSPWSQTYPVTCLGNNFPNVNVYPPTGFNINPINGDLLFRPLQVQISIIKIEVLEWRKINGVSKIIGRTSRDILFIVLQNCNNKLPTFSVPYNFEACAGRQICITINTFDQDLPDTTRLSSNAITAIPGATWTVTPDTVKRAIGTFCWTPDDSLISTKPYYFNTVVTDNHCPFRGIYSRAYSITVKPTPRYNTSITHTSGNQWKFEATPTGTFNNADYQWYIPKLLGAGMPDQVMAISQITHYNFTKDGKYIIRSMMFNNTTCFTEKFDTVDVYCATPLQLSSSNDSTICIGNSISITTSSLTGSAPFKYKWYANGILIDTIQTISISPIKNTVYRVVVVSADTCLFTNADTVNISVDTSTLALQPIPDRRICRGTQILITPTIYGSQIQSFYRWYFNGVIINASKTIAHRPQISGVYVFEVQSKGACAVNLRDTFNVLVDTNIVSLHPMKDTLVCAGATVNFTPNIKTGQAPFHYKWYSNGLLIDTNSSLAITMSTTKSYILEIHSADTCRNTSYDTVVAILDTSKLVVNTLNDAAICQGGTVQFTPNIIKGKQPFQYFWYKNNNLISTSSTLIDMPVSSTTYLLKIISADNCLNTFYDTVNVSFITSTLQLKLTKDTTVCANVPVTLSAQVSGASSPYIYNWCPQGKTCSNLPTPTFSFDANTKVILEVTASDQCTSVKRDTINVQVFPLKQLSIFATNTSINKGQSVVLKSNAIFSYNWSGVNILTHWGDSILVAPTTTSTYYLIGKNQNGCDDTASIQIVVNNVGLKDGSQKREKLMISPNPVSGELLVEYSSGKGLKYTVYNALGQVVLQGELAENNTFIGVQQLSEGLYFISVGQNVRKFVKK